MVEKNAGLNEDNLKKFEDYKQLDLLIKELDEQVKDLKSRRKKDGYKLIDFIQKSGIEKISVSGKTFSVGPVLLAKIIDEEKFFKYLEDTGNDAIIKRSVPWQTLKSFCGDIVKEGDEENLQGVEIEFMDKLYVRSSGK